MKLLQRTVVYALEMSEDKTAVRICYYDGDGLREAWVSKSRVTLMSDSQVSAYRAKDHSPDVRSWNGVELPAVQTDSAREDAPEYAVENGQVVRLADGAVITPAAYRVQALGLPLNYRAAPDGDVVGSVEDGSKIAVVEKGSPWSLVLIGDGLYYVKTGYIIPWTEPAATPVPDATVEPTAEPTAEPVIEPTAKPTAEPAAKPTAEPAPEELPVDHYASLAQQVTYTYVYPADGFYYGDEVTIQAAIPEELLEAATMRWQQAEPDGEWQDMPDQHAPDMTIVITEENADCQWRLVFSIG